MSDWMSAVVDLEASESEAEALAARVLVGLIDDGLIEAKPDPKSIYGGSGGHRPGRKIADWYQLSEGEHPFWQLSTNGLAVEAERWVNIYGMPCLEQIACPACSKSFEDAMSFFSDAIGEFLAGDDRSSADCPSCGVASTVHEWKATPHLGFGKLAFIFWNWPNFDFPEWKRSVPARISQLLSHKVAITYGKL